MTDYFSYYYKQSQQKRAKEKRDRLIKSIAPHLELLDIENALIHASGDFDVLQERRHTRK
jgi:hypothetical protein